MSQNDKITVRCPDCGARLRVDAATGHVLSHEPAEKKAAGKDFDQLLAGLDESKARADEIFRQELDSFENRERLLEEKFREAMKRADDEDDEPPVRPWDLD